VTTQGSVMQIDKQQLISLGQRDKPGAVDAELPD